MEVEAVKPPGGPIQEILDGMEAQGVRLLFGRWLVEGAPYVLLFDVSSVGKFADDWKGELWRTSGIPSPAHDHETNNAILFGYLVAWFLGELSSKVKNLGIQTCMCRNLYFDSRVYMCISITVSFVVTSMPYHRRWPKNLL